MSDITAPYEYVVAQKIEGKWKWRRAGLIFLYILYPLIAITITAISDIGPLLAPLCALLAVSTWMLVFFTWRYVSLEYEYVVVSGRVTFNCIYGGRARKKQLEFALKDAELIAPLNGNEADKLSSFAPEAEYRAVSSDSAPDAYFAIFKDSDGKKCVFMFEATEHMLKTCRMYNPAGTVMSKVRY